MKQYFTSKNKLSILSIALLFGLWILLSMVVDNEIIFPSIFSTSKSLVRIVVSDEFFPTVGATLIRSIIGFLISVVLAIVLGGLSRMYKAMDAIIQPLVSMLSSIPIIAIIILALIWLDNDIVPIFTGFVMIFPLLYETVVGAIDSMDKKLLQMARIYDKTGMDLVLYLYMPRIFAALRSISGSSISTNLKMVIAGEVLSQPSYGIGTELQLQRIYLDTSGVFAWIVVILLISWGLREFINHSSQNKIKR
ncbi:MAG: ABC transporter permease subunit [Gudongella sp.]|nr:ABC transporter permease subunit [Gudongella sp.]